MVWWYEGAQNNQYLDLSATVFPDIMRTQFYFLVTLSLESQDLEPY